MKLRRKSTANKFGMKLGNLDKLTAMIDMLNEWGYDTEDLLLSDSIRLMKDIEKTIKKLKNR